MKILWFSNSAGSAADYLNIYGVGGGWLKSLENALKDKMDLHVAFYYPRYSTNFEYRGVHYYPICNKIWKLEIVKNRLREKFIDAEDFDIYKKIIDQVKPDLIHIHGTENPFGCIIGKVDIPVVVSIQGNITVYHHKYFSGIEKAFLFRNFFSFASIKDFPFLSSFKKPYLHFEKMRHRETRNLAGCEFIIGRTEWDYRITRVLAPKSKYFHGGELLRGAFYQNLHNGGINEKLIIHTTSGNSPYKGFESVCQALSLLNNMGLTLEWRMAGIKESDLIVKVVKKALGKDYPKNGLVLLGGLDEQGLVEKLLEASIYIMPSHIENSPNNLCEAMMLGLPCIATFAGGTGSLLSDGEEGILIQDGDPWAMAGAILQLKNNPEQAAEMGQKARARALKRHNVKSVTEQYLNIYREILENLNK